jgi:hypothetical protein
MSRYSCKNALFARNRHTTIFLMVTCRCNIFVSTMQSACNLYEMDRFGHNMQMKSHPAFWLLMSLQWRACSSHTPKLFIGPAITVQAFLQVIDTIAPYLPVFLGSLIGKMSSWVAY